jgi:ACS family sodium-dependent inorganic phosphate cotransporter-like MFS transporter 5
MHQHVNGMELEKKPPTDDEHLEPPQRWFGTRHFVTFMLFLGMANAYVMRTNMSVAIVAMVNHTAIEAKVSSHDEPIDTECGDVAIDRVSNVFFFFNK